MKVSVKLFARASELAGTNQLELQIPERSTIAGLRAEMLRSCPELSPLMESLHIAVGSEYASDDCYIEPDSEVACFPPVSGG